MGSSSSDNESTMKVSKEEMKKAGIDLAYRDFCAHLLIPLNECRRKSFFLPWKCGDERHEYEKCQYEECVFYVLVFAFVLSSFFPLGISFVFDVKSARVYRVSFDDVFPSKRPFRETRVTDFSRLSRRYMKRVRKMKEQRGEE